MRIKMLLLLWSLRSVAGQEFGRLGKVTGHKELQTVHIFSREHPSRFPNYSGGDRLMKWPYNRGVFSEYLNTRPLVRDE